MDRRHFLRLAPAPLLGLAGCTGSGGAGDGEDETTEQNEEDTTTQTKEETTEQTEDETTTQSGDEETNLDESATVTLTGTDFDPQQVQIAQGGSVTWTNEGTSQHDVIADTLTDAGDSWSFSSETLGSGDSTSFTFEESGVFEYYCSIHGDADMCGVVLVGDTSYSETLPCEGSDGGFY